MNDSFEEDIVTNPAQIEPSAELRSAAKNLRQMFIALIKEGFTERQALAVIGHILAAGNQNGGGA